MVNIHNKAGQQGQPKSDAFVALASSVKIQ